MVSKALIVLKNNPVIVVLYFAYTLIMTIWVLLFSPTNFSSSQMSDPRQVQSFLLQMLIYYVSLGIIGLIGLIFLSGFGHMITEAVQLGKTSITSFIPGIKKFFKRILLSALLLCSFLFGFSMVISMLVMIPIVFMTLANGNVRDPSTITGITTVSMGVIFGLMMFAIPFIMLWFPAIFIEDNKVIYSAKCSLKASRNNYGKLFLITLCIYLPIVASSIFAFSKMDALNNSIDVKSLMLMPEYLALMGISSLISLVVLPLFFIIYNDYKEKEALKFINSSEVYLNVE